MKIELSTFIIVSVILTIIYWGLLYKYLKNK